MSSLGPAEIIGIIVIALLLFGSRKLPELGSSVGKTITSFKKGIAEARDEEDEETSLSAPSIEATSVEHSKNV